MAAVLADYAEECGMPYRFLGLNDAPGLHQARVGEYGFAFRGFGRSKERFVLAALRLALGDPQLIVAAHPNLGPVARTMKFLTPRLGYLVLAYGIEVWKPLPVLRRWALREADLIVGISTDTVQKLLSVQNVPERKLHHLPLAIDPDFAMLSSDLDANSPPSSFPAGRVVLSVGRLAANERYKGLDCLIQAVPRVLSSVGDLQLVVVGDGDDRPRLEALAQEVGVAGRVHFLGYLSKEELIACYRHCNVFGLPSRGEGFGLVFLEAMALGKPILGPSYGAPTEFIRHGQHGLLVEPDDPSAVAEALIELLASPERAGQMGEAARQWVMGEFTFERFHERLRRLLSHYRSNQSKKV